MEFAFNIGPSSELTFSRSGRYLATMNGVSVVVWEVARGKVVRHIQPLSNPANIAFSLDEQRIAVKNTSGQFAVATIERGEPMTLVRSRSEHDAYRLICIDEEFFLDANRDGMMSLVDMNGVQARTLPAFEGRMITDLDFDPETRRLAIVELLHRHHPDGAGGRVSYLHLWQWPFSENQPVRVPHPFTSALSVCFTRGGKLIAVLSNNNRQLTFLDAATLEVVHEVEPRHRKHRNLIAAYHHRDALLNYGGEQELTEITWPDGEQRGFTVQPMSVFVALSLSPDDRYLAGGAWRNGRVYLTGQQVEMHAQSEEELVGVY